MLMQIWNGVVQLVKWTIILGLYKQAAFEEISKCSFVFQIEIGQIQRSKSLNVNLAKKTIILAGN